MNVQFEYDVFVDTQCIARRVSTDAAYNLAMSEGRKPRRRVTEITVRCSDNGTIYARHVRRRENKRHE